MKITSGNTTLIVLESHTPYLRVRDTPNRIAESIERFVNSDASGLLQKNVEVKVTGNHIAVFVTTEAAVNALVCIVFSYLHDVCIVEECCPYAERYLVKLLHTLSRNEEHSVLANQLNTAIRKHEQLAVKSFGGDMYFAAKSNCEFVGDFLGAEN